MKQFYNNDFSSNYDELISYYPRYYRNVREIVAILKADGKLLDRAQNAVEQIYKNGFIDSMDEYEIRELEKFLNIKQREQRTLDERRRLIKSYFIGFGKVSATLLSSMIQAYAGCTAEIKFEPFDAVSNNKLYISLFPKNNTSFFIEDVFDILSQKVPAHIPYSVTVNHKSTVANCYVAATPCSIAIQMCVHLPKIKKGGVE